MKILELNITGFLSLKEVAWKPGDLNLIIGSNGSGKSNLLKALETGEESAVVMGQIKKREAAAGRLAREVAVETQRLKAERHAVDSFQEEQQRLTELMTGSSREARLALRALFHRIIERVDFFVAGLFEVPSDMKVVPGGAPW